MAGVILDDFIKFLGNFKKAPKIEITLFLDFVEREFICCKHGEFMRSDSFKRVKAYSRLFDGARFDKIGFDKFFLFFLQCFLSKSSERKAFWSFGENASGIPIERRRVVQDAFFS
jgi:hypothetical protein